MVAFEAAYLELVRRLLALLGDLWSAAPETESRLKAWCRHSSAQGRRGAHDLGGEGFDDHVDLGLVVDLALRLGLGSLKGLGGLHGSGLRHRKQAAVYGVGR